MERKPLAIDLCAGLGGWTDGLLAEGWDCVGYDIERHKYGSHQYPAQLVLQDILTLDGRQFRGHVSLIVASPPCQRYSYMAMPWKRAKDLIAWHRDPAHPERIEELNALFKACVRIGREAGCPIVIENVRGAQPWVGRSRWNYGSFHLFGDVPALMPITFKGRKVPMASWRHPSDPRHVPGQGFNTLADRQLREGVKIAGARGDDWFTHHNRAEFMERAGVETVHLEATPFGTAVVSDQSGQMLYNLPPEFYPDRSTKNDGGSWFNIAHNTTSGKGRNPDGRMGLPELCPNCCAAAIAKGLAKGGAICEGCSFAGVKGFTPHGQPLGKNELGRKHGSKSSARKAASALIAKIPLPLARHIARCYFPK